MKNFLKFREPGDAPKFLFCFLFFSSVMWILVPAFSRAVLHYDPAETLMWGSTFNLGTAKHPPMAGYMLYHFCSLFGFHDFSVYLLSQICVAIGFFFIFKLSRCFFDPGKSVMATLLITFYFFYNSETPKFNANIPHILFIPMMCYYFYVGIRENRLYQWALLGFSAACAFLSKYYAGVVLLSLFAYTVFDRDARKIFRSWKPYFAAVLFLIFISPHLYHLFSTGFLSFEYIADAKEKNYTYFIRILAMAGAMAAPLLCMSCAAAATGMIAAKRFSLPFCGWKDRNRAAAGYSLFLIGGQAAVFLLMAVADQRVESMWTFQMFLPAGILIMSFYSPAADSRTMKVFAVLSVLFAVAVLGSDFTYSSVRTAYRRHLDKAELKKAAEDFYFEKTGGKEIPFITGEIWHASILQNVFGYRIKACPDKDPILLRIHRNTLEKGNVLAISPHPESDGMMIGKFFGIKPEWTVKEIPCKARFGKRKFHRIYLAILPPVRPDAPCFSEKTEKLP